MISYPFLFRQDVTFIIYNLHKAIANIVFIPCVGIADTAVTIKSYRYCRIHFTPTSFHFSWPAPSIFGHKKSRPSAGMCENLAKYGLLGYAHLFLNCINLKHLCSPLPIILIQCNDAPLYSINDEPPCTPLIIVKRVPLGSRTGQGFGKKEKGVYLHPLRLGVCTPLTSYFLL